MGNSQKCTHDRVYGDSEKMPQKVEARWSKNSSDKEYLFNIPILVSYFDNNITIIS